MNLICYSLEHFIKPLCRLSIQYLLKHHSVRFCIFGSFLFSDYSFAWIQDIFYKHHCFVRKSRLNCFSEQFLGDIEWLLTVGLINVNNAFASFLEVYSDWCISVLLGSIQYFKINLPLLMLYNLQWLFHFSLLWIYIRILMVAVFFLSFDLQDPSPPNITT